MYKSIKGEPIRPKETRKSVQKEQTQVFSQESRALELTWDEIPLQEPPEVD